MDLLKELRELKDTIGNEIMQANQEIRKSGGDLNSGDIEMIDKLTHAMKSLATTCAMLEAEEGDGYSERYMPMGPYYGGGYGGGYSGRRDGYIRDGRNGGGNYGGYARNEGRYSRETKTGTGYSRSVDWGDNLRQMMDEAPDEATRMEIKKLMDRMAN